MDVLGFISTILVSLIGVLGVWLTKRDVKTVRHENSRQHGEAQQERAQAHDMLLGKVNTIHEDVRTVIGHVAVVDQKLDDHLKTPHY